MCKSRLSHIPLLSLSPYLGYSISHLSPLKSLRSLSISLSLSFRSLFLSDLSLSHRYTHSLSPESSDASPSPFSRSSLSPPHLSPSPSSLSSRCLSLSLSICRLSRLDLPLSCIVCIECCLSPSVPAKLLFCCLLIARIDAIV